MGAIGGEELMKWEKMQGLSGREEKILVLVRLRPLSDKEIVSNEVADWECINDTTILYRNTLREGSTFPSAYSFGKDTFIYIFILFNANPFNVSTSSIMILYVACIDEDDVLLFWNWFGKTVVYTWKTDFDSWLKFDGVKLNL